MPRDASRVAESELMYTPCDKVSKTRDKIREIKDVLHQDIQSTDEAKLFLDGVRFALELADRYAYDLLQDMKTWELKARDILDIPSAGQGQPSDPK